MKNNDFACVMINIGQWCMALFTIENLQILQLILAILSTVIILTLKIIDWVKKAKADQKISSEELDELSNILKETYDEVHTIKETHFGGNQSEEHPEVKK